MGFLLSSTRDTRSGAARPDAASRGPDMTPRPTRATIAAALAAALALAACSSSVPMLGQEVTSLRSATSFVAFQQASRVATIQISGRSLGGSTVEMVMAPRGAGEGAGPGGGTGAGPGRGGIEASPNPPPRR